MPSTVHDTDRNADKRTAGTAAYGPVKAVALSVIVLMLGAICYGAFITMKYWAGIGV